VKGELPAGWELVKIRDIATIEKNVATPDSLNGNSQKFIGLENIERDSGRLVNFSEISGDELRSTKFKFTPEHILYGKLRPYLNKVFLPDFEGVCSTDILTIKPHPKKVVKKFLELVLKGSDFVEYATTRSIGANLPRVSPSTMLDYSFALPPLSIQRQIVAVLEHAEAVKRQRNEADALTGALLQSVFLEIFGDPVRNEKGWQVKAVDQLVKDKKSISCGPFGSQLKVSDYVDDGVLVLGIDNIGINRFIWKNPRYISLNKFAGLNAFVVNPDDIIISRAGTVGRTCVVPEKIHDAIIGSNLLKVTLDQSKLLPIFLTTAISFAPSIIEEIKMSSPGAMYSFLNSKNLRLLKIIVPPLAIQQKFVQIVESVERIRDQQVASGQQIKGLCEVLMARAFVGELVA
jgi:type I restriction enzyme S subunit